MGIITLAVLAVKVWAFVDALIRPTEAYVAADKLTKPAWLLILGLTVVSAVLLGSTLLLIVGIVAAFVYILDVSPPWSRSPAAADPRMRRHSRVRLRRGQAVASLPDLRSEQHAGSHVARPARRPGRDRP